MKEIGEIPGTKNYFISGQLVLLVDPANCSPYFRVGRVGTMTRPHEWGDRPMARLLVSGLLKLEQRQREKRYTLGIAACVNARGVLEEQLKEKTKRERGIAV